MKKIKIIDIKKTNPDWSPENKKYTMSSCWATVDIITDDKHVEKNAKVCWFSASNKAEAGKEFDDDTIEIKEEVKNYNGEDYLQITLKAKKKEFQASGKGGQQFYKKKISVNEFKNAVAICDMLAGEYNTDKESATNRWSYFSCLLKAFMDNVDMTLIEESFKKVELKKKGDFTAFEKAWNEANDEGKSKLKAALKEREWTDEEKAWIDLIIDNTLPF